MFTPFQIGAFILVPTITFEFVTLILNVVNNIFPIFSRVWTVPISAELVISIVFMFINIIVMLMTPSLVNFFCHTMHFSYFTHPF